MNRALRRAHQARTKARTKRLSKAFYLYEENPKSRDTRVARLCRCSWCAPHRANEGLTLAERRACDAAWQQIDELHAAKRMADLLNPPDEFQGFIDLSSDISPEQRQMFLDEFAYISSADLNSAYAAIEGKKL